MVCSPANKDNTGLAQKKENKGYLTNHSLCHYFLLFEILMGTVSNGMVHFSIDDNVTSQTRYSFKLIYPASAKCPNTEFFLVQIQENTGQKKLCVRTLFTQC